ncbi:MAG: hypothetical protein ACRCSU_03245 [Paracoccaceae bacterium]
MQNDRATLAGRLTRLLQAEADALHGGRFDLLSALTDEKTQIVAAFTMADGPLTRDRAQALRRAAERSERLLSAALRGARAARTRHAAVTRAASGLETYGPRGSRQVIGTANTLLERKA